MKSAGISKSGDYSLTNENPVYSSAAAEASPGNEAGARAAGAPSKTGGESPPAPSLGFVGVTPTQTGWRNHLKAFLLAIGLSLFFTLPAFADVIYSLERRDAAKKPEKITPDFKGRPSGPLSLTPSVQPPLPNPQKSSRGHWPRLPGGLPFKPVKAGPRAPVRGLPFQDLFGRLLGVCSEALPGFVRSEAIHGRGTPLSFEDVIGRILSAGMASADAEEPNPATNPPSSVHPIVKILEPSDGFATNAGEIIVRVGFSAKLEDGGKPAGNVKTIILKMNGEIAGTYENPPKIKEGVAVFTISVKNIEGKICFVALAYQGDTKARLVTSEAVCILRDVTACALSGEKIPAANVRGWNRTDVEIRFNAHDEEGGSGVVFVSPPVTLTQEGKDQVVKGECRDAAGNVSQTEISTSIDKTNPIPTLETSIQPSPFGWYATPATVSVAATDNLSGVVSTSDPVTLDKEGAGQKVAGSAIDAADNEGTVTREYDLDFTPATISVSPANGSTVTTATPQLIVSYTDNLSGLNLDSFKASLDSVDVTTSFTKLADGATFTPATELATGEHTLFAQIEDRAGHLSQVVSVFNIETEEAKTVLRGRVLSVEGPALGGVPVRLAGLQRLTGGDGRFEIPGEPGIRLLEVDGRSLGYAYVFCTVELKEGINFIGDIFLPKAPIEEKGDQVVNNETTIVANPDVPGVEIAVAPNSATNPDGSPFTGKLVVLAVDSSRLPFPIPADLGLEPNRVFMIQSGDVLFTREALITLADQFACGDGLILDLWVFNPVTCQYEIAGTGVVQGGQIVMAQGGLSRATWFFFLPKAPNLQLAKNPAHRPARPGSETGVSGLSVIDSSLVPVGTGGAMANASTGELEAEIALPGVQFLGQNFAPRLVYHSGTACPRSIIEANLDYSAASKPITVQDRVTVDGIQSEGVFRDVRSVQGNLFRIAHQVDLSQVPNGVVEVNYTARGVYCQTDAGKEVRSTSISFPLLVCNRGKSPFGAGWGLDLGIPGGLQRLLPVGSGAVASFEGDGTCKLYSRAVPRALAFGDQLWIIEVISGSIDVYSAKSLSLIRQFDLGSPAITLALDKQQFKVYVMTFDPFEFKARLHEIDATDFSVRSSQPFPGFLPDARQIATVASAFGQVLVEVMQLPSHEPGILVLSKKTLAPERFMIAEELGITFPAMGFVPSSDGKTAWLGGGVAGLNPRIAEIDLEALAVRRHIPVESEGDFRFAVSESRREIYALVGRPFGFADFDILSLDSGARKARLPFVGRSGLGGPGVTLGYGSHVYISVLDTLISRFVVKLINVFDATIANSQLASNVRLIESVEGDTRLFVTNVEGSQLRLLDGPTGQTLTQTPFSGAAIALRFLPSPLGPHSIPFASPAGDFSILALNTDGTTDPDDDFYIRFMKDGSKQFFSRDGLLEKFSDRNGNTFLFTYTDANGDGKAEELSDIATPAQTHYVFTYAGGRLASVLDPAGRLTTFTMGPAGDLVGVRFPNGASREYAYDSRHLMTSCRDERSFSTGFDFDLFCAVDGIRLPNSSSMGIDPASIAGLVDPSSGQGTEANPAAGVLVESVRGLFSDGRGFNTEMRTDSLGATTQLKDAIGNVTTMQRDGDSLPVKVINGRGAETDLAYTARGNLEQVKDPIGAITGILFDPVFNVPIQITDALNHVVSFELDTRGNVIRIRDPLQNVTKITYTVEGLVKTITDAVNATVTFDYGAQGRLIGIRDPLQNPTVIDYDLAGNVRAITDALSQSRMFFYDEMNRVVREVDAMGNETTRKYDEAGNLTLFTDFTGATWLYLYNELGQRIGERDPLGHMTFVGVDAIGNEISSRENRTTPSGEETLETLRTYDGMNRPVKVTYPDGAFVEMRYNQVGEQIESIDELGRKTGQFFDLAGRSTKTSYPDGTFETTEYNILGWRVKHTDQKGRETKFEQDEMGRVVKTRFADGTFTTSQFNEVGRLLAAADERGNPTNYLYDPAGRLEGILNVRSVLTRFEHDAVGNQISVTDGNRNTIRYGYDANNRRIKNLFPDGTEQTTDYDAAGRRIAEKDQAGKITRYRHDALGRLVGVLDALNQETTYEFDEVGGLIAQVDALQRRTEFVQDNRGRRIKRTLPLGMFETTEYDPGGNMLRHTDFNGKTTTMVHDLMNRLVEKIPDPSLGEPSIHFTYTATGQRASMRDGTGLTTYGHDLRDRLNEKATPLGTLFYTRDATGNVTSIKSSNPNGVSVNYRWDDLNRLDNVHDDRLGAFIGDTSHFYDDANNLTGFGNAARRMLFFHDSLNRLKEVQIDSLFGIANRFTYTLGPAGNRTAVTELNGRSVDYGYDDLYRLVLERISGDSVPANNGSISYVLDAVGNRLRRDSTVAPVPSGVSAYDDNDRLASDGYDNNGNTISFEGKSYTYNFENRIKSVNGGESLLDYDGDGHLVGITSGGLTTNFLVDDLNPTGYSQVMEELVNGQVVRIYTYGLDLLTQNQLVGGVWTPSFYGYDAQMSVRALFNSFGQVTDRYDFDAFGIAVNSSGMTPNKYLYAGEQRLSELNLYYVRARYLQPSIGRFFTLDPSAGSLSLPWSLNKYLYADSDPANKRDPSGRFTYIEILFTAAIVGLFYGTYTGRVASLEGKSRTHVWAVQVKAFLEGFAFAFVAIGIALETFYAIQGILYFYIYRFPQYAADTDKFVRHFQELGKDPAIGGEFRESQAIGGLRIEKFLGRMIKPGEHPGVDFVDEVVLGNLSLKGPLPPEGSVKGLAQSVIKDAMTNTATKNIFVDLSGLSPSEQAAIESIILSATSETPKRIFFLKD